MATITLKEGDFGSDVPVNVGSETLYLPDREHPGLTLAVSVADVVEMESIDHDALRPVKQALKTGAKGLFVGPAGLAAGFYSATKVKDVTFTATLSDGRRFVAVAGAKTYADLHAAQLAARTAAMRGVGDDDAPSPADDIIAKYLEAAKSSPADPPPAKSSPEPPSERRVGERRTGEPRQGERRQQPTFGRRRSS